MVEIVFYFLIAFFLIYLVVKGLGNIFKGTLILLLAILIFYLSFHRTSPVNFSGWLPTVSNFLRFNQEESRIRLFSLKILGYFYDDKRLFIIIKNTGFLPLTDLEVYLDDNRVDIINKPLIILPQRIENIEVEAKNFTKITVASNNFKFEYLK